MWWDERSCSTNARKSPPPSLETLKAVVDLDCDYTRELVLASFSRRPEWKVASRSFSDFEHSFDEQIPCARDDRFLWSEYERIDWSAVDEGNIWASCYCIRKGLIRKAHLAHNMKKWAAKRPNGWIAKSVPESYIMDVDDPEYLEEALCEIPEVRDMKEGSEIWIAKPSITNQGLSICVFDRVSTLAKAVEAAEDMREWVVQRYIHPPLLLHDRKFHLRAYALCVGSLTVYVFSEVLVLSAGSKYDSKLGDLENLGSHLTNTCRQTEAEENSTSDEKDVVHLLSELPKELARDGHISEGEAAGKVENLSKAINEIIGECFEAVSGELTFFTLPNCFELFGFDLMVDAEWKCWLLEANAEPDFRQTGSRLKPIIQGLVERTLDIVLDPISVEEGLLKGNEKRASIGRGEWQKVFQTQQRRPF